MTKTIRSMDDDTWNKIKRRAADKGKTIAEYLRSLVNDENNADVILNGKKHLDGETAKQIRRRSKDLKHSFRMQK